MKYSDKKSLNKEKGKNFTSAQIGSWEELDYYAFSHPSLPEPYSGKLFLKKELNLTGMEVSVNKMPPGASMPFSHKHRESEEFYLFVKGKGEFEIDGEVIPIKEGTVIRVAPEGVRTWRNTSETEDMYFFVVQTKAGSFSAENVSDGIAV